MDFNGVSERSYLADVYFNGFRNSHIHYSSFDRTFTVKLYKKKLLVLSLVVLLLLPAFIPVESGRCGVYKDGEYYPGMEYHALTYSIVTRTVEDEAVDFNFAIFPFNFKKEVYRNLDNFE